MLGFASGKSVASLHRSGRLDLFLPALETTRASPDECFKIGIDVWYRSGWMVKHGETW